MAGKEAQRRSAAKNQPLKFSWELRRRNIPNPRRKFLRRSEFAGRFRVGGLTKETGKRKKSRQQRVKICIIVMILLIF